MDPAAPSWLEEIDHTADTGFVVTAADLPTLFARAAWGMFSIITDPVAVRAVETESVSITAGDLGELMLRWLNELNFRHVTRGKVFGQFDIQEVCEMGIEASVGGESIDPDRHPLHTEIKAVTYHELKVEPTPEGWRAVLIFDL